jgi:triosephosphate isomerase
MSGKARGPFVAGNWKMHMTVPQAKELVRGITRSAADLEGAEVVVIPPYTALAESAGAIEGTAVELGAQNLFWEDKGAFTGEISGPMLKNAGCRYVIVGHSERRQHFGETGVAVNKKIRAALRAGLRPIFCFGESLEEREAGTTMSRVDVELDEGLRDISAEDLGSIVFAYEPVWAIGTGLTATPRQAEEVHAHVRKRLQEKYGNRASDCAIILYGGSVKPANSYSLFKEEDIDGFLVGGASLEADSFVDIVREALRAHKEKQ